MERTREQFEKDELTRSIEGDSDDGFEQVSNFSASIMKSVENLEFDELVDQLSLRQREYITDDPLSSAEMCVRGILAMAPLMSTPEEAILCKRNASLKRRIMFEIVGVSALGLMTGDLELWTEYDDR